MVDCYRLDWRGCGGLRHENNFSSNKAYAPPPPLRQAAVHGYSKKGGKKD
jgi:hypothetical protein